MLEMHFKIKENIKSLKKFQQLLVHYKITGVGQFSHRFVRTGLVSFFVFFYLLKTCSSINLEKSIC